MDKITIYRIEHSIDKKGLFTSNYFKLLHHPYMDELYNRHSLLPTPQLDYKLKYIDGDEYCAFKSIDDLKKWVTNDEMIFLIDRGFKILKLVVMHARIGNSQVLFKKKHIIAEENIANQFK